MGRKEPRGPALGLAPASAHAHPQGSAYQGAAAEQDHEDDEGLKPVVLDDLEAGPAEGPPRLPAALGDVHVEAGTALHTGWGAKGPHVTGLAAASDACQRVPVTSQDACPPRPAPHCPPDPASSLPPNPWPPVLHCWMEMGPAPLLEWGSQALPPQPTAPCANCCQGRTSRGEGPSSGTVPSSPLSQAAFTPHSRALFSRAVP